MTKVRIKRLAYSNFKAQTRELEFSDGGNLISGKNESGKSTVFDAIMWLLTGYDMNDRSNFELFDTRIEFTKDNAIGAIVEATIEIDDNTYQIKRTAKQKWTLDRSTGEYVKAPNDDYHLYIDGLEFKPKDFAAFISQHIADTSKIKLVMNPEYLMLLDWSALRTFFNAVVGEIILEGYDELLPELKLKKIEDIRDAYHKKVTLSFDTKKTVETEIKTLEQTVTPMQEIEEAEKEIATLEAKSAELQKRIEVLSRSEVSLDREKQILSLDEELKSRIESHNRKIKEDAAALETEKKNALDYNRQVESIKKTHDIRLREAQTLLDAYNQMIDAKRDELKTIVSSVFSGLCPTCGQRLPEKDFEEQRKDYEYQQTTKKKLLEKEGLELKAKIESQQAVVDGIINEEIPTKKDITPINERIEKNVLETPAAEGTPWYKEITEKIAALKATVDEEVHSEEVDVLSNEQAEVLAKIRDLREVACLRKKTAETLEMIEKKKAILDKATKEMVESRRKEFLATEYIEEFANEAARRANSILPDDIRVDMFKRKKDGTITPSCRIYRKGVFHKTDNTANRKLVAIEVSKAFCKVYGIDMPIMIDETNSMDKWHTPKIDGQYFLIRVTDEDFKVSSL
jgi:DNA repair exonuclease SbcCD ATPase subunit